MNEMPDSVPLAGGILGQQRHVCAFFDSPDEAHRVLLPFVKEGLERGEKVIQIVDPASYDDHLGSLGAAEIDVAAAQARGQLEVRDWQDTYLRGGTFDRRAMSAFVESILSLARADGFSRARVIAHMEWALQDSCDLTSLVEYESGMNDVLPRYDDPIVCAYDRSRFGAGTTMDVIRAHPMMILDGMLRESPCFLPPARLIPRLHGSTLAVIRDRYVAALMVGTRREALDIVVEEALWQEVPVAALYLEVIQPAQYEIGRLWEAGRITVAEEHLATEISRSALAHLQPHLPSEPRNGRQAVVACVEGELHDLGARMVAHFLETAGFEVLLLGANVPDGSLVEFVRERSADLLALSATTSCSLTALRETITQLRSAAGDGVAIAAGGQALSRRPGLARRLGADLHARNARDMAVAAGRFFNA
jgi:methanogenic corrinoid protein MtbC1